jgi:imidazole glycerol phosphate synthase glutamine amidotransferase subunit
MRVVSIFRHGPSSSNSLVNLFSTLGFRANIVNRMSEYIDSDLIVIPGVGHFGSSMKRFVEEGLDNLLSNLIISGKPTLGICLGMQMLGKTSDEDKSISGLGLFDFKSESLGSNAIIGWRKLENPLSEIYFHNHGYGVFEIKGVTEIYYDQIGFVSIFTKDKVVGMQFHPEKSQESGRKIIEYYCAKLWF